MHKIKKNDCRKYVENATALRILSCSIHSIPTCLSQEAHEHHRLASELHSDVLGRATRAADRSTLQVGRLGRQHQTVSRDRSLVQNQNMKRFLMISIGMQWSCICLEEMLSTPQDHMVQHCSLNTASQTIPAPGGLCISASLCHVQTSLKLSSP